MINYESFIPNNTYAELKTDPSGNKYWFIHIIVKNTGTKTATIDNIFVNGKLGKITCVSYENNKFIPLRGLTINPGEGKELVFILSSTGIIKEVRYTTREDPEPDKNEPYISYYPVEITSTSGDNVTITVVVKQDNEQSLNGVDIVVIDENNKLITYGDGLSFNNKGILTWTKEISLTTMGIHTWKIEAVLDYKHYTDTNPYDVVIITVKIIEPIILDKFQSGQTINIILHTTSGKQYPTKTTLP